MEKKCGVKLSLLGPLMVGNDGGILIKFIIMYL
jgi:hypothetical protein